MCYPEGCSWDPAWAVAPNHVPWLWSHGHQNQGHLLFLSASMESSRRGTSQTFKWNRSELSFWTITMANSIFPRGSVTLWGVVTVQDSARAIFLSLFTTASGTERRTQIPGRLWSHLEPPPHCRPGQSPPMGTLQIPVPRYPDVNHP